MTKERPLTLLEMFQQGMTNQEIEAKISKSADTISYHRNKFIKAGKLDKKFKRIILHKSTGNTRLRTKILDTHPMTPVLGKVTSQVLNYLKEGYNSTEICELTGKVHGTISYHIKKINDLNLLGNSETQMPETVQQVSAFPNASKTVVYNYPPECVTGGQRAAYTRKLRSQEKAPKITTPKPTKDIVKSNSDLLFIVNGVSVTVHHNSLKNVFVGKDKIVVNF